MDLKEIECENLDWIHLAQGRIQWRAHVNTVMSLQWNFLTKLPPFLEGLLHGITFDSWCYSFLC